MDAVIGDIVQVQDVDSLPTTIDGPKAKTPKGKSTKTLSSKFTSFFGRKGSPEDGKPKSSRRSARAKSARAKGVQLSQISGSWVSHLDFDGVRYWTLLPENTIDVKDVKIKSDTSISKLSIMSRDTVVPIKEEDVLSSDCR